MRFGRRTWKVKCPDGTSRIVYKDLDDVFPLAIRASSGRLVASAKDLSGNSIGVDAELRRAIDGFLYELNERNATMLVSLRATYSAYQVNPCRNDERLAQRIEEMTVAQQQVEETWQELRALIELAAVAPGDPESAWQAFAAIVAKSGARGVPQATAARLRAAQRAARGWIEGKRR